VICNASDLLIKNYNSQIPIHRRERNCLFCVSSLRTKAQRTQRGYFSFVNRLNRFVFYKNLFNLRHLVDNNETSLFIFVANKDIKDAKKINPFRIKTFVFFASWCETLKTK
jgi:hypothetical protein